MPSSNFFCSGIGSPSNLNSHDTQRTMSVPETKWRPSQSTQLMVSSNKESRDTLFLGCLKRGRLIERERRKEEEEEEEVEVEEEKDRFDWKRKKQQPQDPTAPPRPRPFPFDHDHIFISSLTTP